MPMVRIALSFDYDSPAGYAQSFHMKGYPRDADLRGTKGILEILKQYEVKATFAVVGHVAVAGVPPEHCPDQVRLICEAGHEIASHSMTHRYLPSLNRDEMMREFLESKEVLQQCLGREVRGFVPPFNRPMNFPSRGAFSVAEMCGLLGRGRGRQTIESMLKGLKDAGYGWCRVSYENKLRQMIALCRRHHRKPLRQPFIFNGIVTISLHSTGFGEDTQEAVRRSLQKDKDSVLCVCAHPSQAYRDSSESIDSLSNFLKSFLQSRIAGTIGFCTMREVEALVREAARGM